MPAANYFGRQTRGHLLRDSESETRRPRSASRGFKVRSHEVISVSRASAMLDRWNNGDGSRMRRIRVRKRNYSAAFFDDYFRSLVFSRVAGI